MKSPTKVQSNKCSVLQHFVEVHSSSVISFNLRLSHIIRKISSALHGIETSLLLPDVELDDLMMEREQKMNSEFARRFSRNNLYSIHLKVSKLENEIVTFRSNRCCKISKAVILRALVLSLMSHLSHSIQMYDKFMRKSKLKCLLKLNDLMDYLRGTFQIITYIVDTGSIETLDVSETICLILKLSRERKCKINSKDYAIKNKMQFSGNKIDRSKLAQDRKFANKNLSWSVKTPKRTAVLKNNANKRRVSYSISGSFTRQEKVSDKNSTGFENDIRANNDMEKKSHQKYSALKLQKIFFELSNKLMHELVVEVSNDMTECISNLIVDAYKQELVNINLR